MKKFLYGAIYFFVLAMIFKGFLTEAAESMGFNLPTTKTILISNNGGNDWQKPEVKGKDINGGNFFFNTENPSEIFLASNSEIFRIKDKEEVNAFSTKKNIGSGYVSEFIQDPENPNILYLVSNEIGKSTLLVSRDYGENFASIFGAEKNDKISVFKINPVDGNYLYIGTQKGLFLTSDNGGLSWKKKKSFSPSPIKEISVSGASGEIYISLSSKIINLFSSQAVEEVEPATYLSIDGGNSFSSIRKLKGLQVAKITIDDNAGRVYFISGYEIFVYENDKVSSLSLLSSADGSTITAFTISPKNSNILYMAIDNMLYRTIDRGNSWGIINVPTTGRQISDIKINEENPNIILLSINN